MIVVMPPGWRKMGENYEGDGKEIGGKALTLDFTLLT